MSKLKGILTEEDKQKFLAKLMEDHVKSKRRKTYEMLFESRVMHMCPYCKEYHIFPMVGEGGIRKTLTFRHKNQQIDREFLITPCPKTGRYVFFYADLIEEGDLLTGEHYKLDIHSLTDEEVRQALDWKMVKLDDELRKVLGIKEKIFKFF
ncbi:MAG: hypothetical protein ACPLVI_06090 [Thermoplasmata archaeon]